MIEDRIERLEAKFLQLCELINNMIWMFSYDSTHHVEEMLDKLDKILCQV